jgi:hypothetical protein
MSEVNQFVSAYLAVANAQSIVIVEKTIEKTEPSPSLNIINETNGANGKKHEIRNLFVTTVTNEAVQAFYKVLFSPKKTIKILWILSLIVSNALNAYLVIQSILSYLSFQVSTSSKFLTENPTLFPKITICK